MLKKLAMIFVPTAVLLSVSACSKQETYTTEYLKANPDVLEKVLADCEANKQLPENCDRANDIKSSRKLLGIK